MRSRGIDIRVNAVPQLTFVVRREYSHADPGSRRIGSAHSSSIALLNAGVPIESRRSCAGSAIPYRAIRIASHWRECGGQVSSRGRAGGAKVALSVPGGATFPEVQLLRCSRVIQCRTREKEKAMKTNLVRTNGLVIDGWPVLVAYAVYVMAFYIFAMMMSSVFLVA